MNERILLSGIEKIDLKRCRIPLFSSCEDKPLAKYLKSHPINELEFDREQKYFKTYTEKELNEMTRAVRGGATESFKSWHS